jgi:hypothetical protein
MIDEGTSPTELASVVNRLLHYAFPVRKNVVQKPESTETSSVGFGLNIGN